VRHHDLEPLKEPAIPSGVLPTLNDFRETVYTQAEGKYLLELMKVAGKDLPAACRISGLSQSRLYALLKSHDLHRG
jgi:two-component system NtrC family response regulator